MDNTYIKFREHVISNSLVVPCDRVLLAVSAGKDSMAMLHLMSRLKSEISFEIGVFHLNHMTRGPESDADEEFVARTAAEMGLFVMTEHRDVKSERPGGISFEEHARYVRYSLLERIAASHGFNRIATAHTSDDNAETLLLRIFSGTGIYGLKGIPLKRGDIIRPMLCLSSLEIYAYLEKNIFAWREDSSNRDTGYLRNYIRNRILPVIEERFPGARERINGISIIARENYTLIDDLLDKVYGNYIRKDDKCITIHSDEIGRNIRALKYILQKTLTGNFGIKVSVSKLDEIIRIYSQPGSNSLLYEKKGVSVRKKHENGSSLILIYAEKSPSLPLSSWCYTASVASCGSIFLPETGGRITIEKSSYDIYLENNNDENNIFIALKPAHDIIVIRSRKNGDRIVLDYGIKKIKELMIEKKLDSDIKNKVPIIEIGGEIAACFFEAAGVRGNRVSCNFYVSGDSEKIFRIRYSK